MADPARTVDHLFDGFHSTPSTETIPHPEDIRNVYPVVTHPQKDAQRFEILTYSVSSSVHMARRQLQVALPCIFGEAVEYTFTAPSVGDLVEGAGNDHALQGIEGSVHPRIVLLELTDAYLRCRLHASPDAIVICRA